MLCIYLRSFVPTVGAEANSIIGLAIRLASAKAPVLSWLDLLCVAELTIFLGSVLGDLYCVGDNFK
jgi:hypothetical protein